MPSFLHNCINASGKGSFHIEWVVERWMPKKGYSSQAQHSREVSFAEAQRFCKKHGIKFPGVSNKD